MGNTFCSNAAQCGQVREENSTIVTGALAGPSVMSGRATGCATNAASALCAIARSINAARGKAASKPRDSAATKIRRITFNGVLHSMHDQTYAVANLKPKIGRASCREREKISVAEV